MNATHQRPDISLDHVGIVVPDLDVAVDFFSENFDATIEFHLDRFIDSTGEAVGRLGAKKGTSFALTMMLLGGGRLELLQWWPEHLTGTLPAMSEPNVPGATHLAIRVSDVPATLARVGTSPGVAVLSDTVTFDAGPTPGMSNAFLRTPWGLLIELISWPSS